MCAHVSADEQFIMFSAIPSNPDFPFWILSQSFGENFSEAVRQNPECKAWDQASDQGVVLLSTASVITYAYRIIVYIFHTYCLAAAQNGPQGNMCSNYWKYSKTLCTCTDYNLATMQPYWNNGY